MHIYVNRHPKLPPDRRPKIVRRNTQIFSYLKAAFVLLLTFVLTALFMLMLYGVLVLALPKNLNDIAIGFFLFASIVLFAGACLQYFAKYFLYDKDDRAELQLLGGVRFGDTQVEAMLTGKGATWPFAKLSASQETLRLQTPFGNYTRERADPRLIIQKTGLSGQWKIGAEDAALTRPIVFSTLFWKTKLIERKLKELGYEVRPHAHS
jgi:hypothetical protein